MTTNSPASMRAADSMTSTFFGFTVAFSTSESSCVRGRALRRAALSAFFRYSGPNHTWFQDGYAPSNTDFTSADLPEPDSPRTTVTGRSEEHTSELQSLMRISYAVF